MPPSLGKTNPLAFEKDQRRSTIGNSPLLQVQAAVNASFLSKLLKEEFKIGTPPISNFIIPIGATVNMDGTAPLSKTITTLLSAQAYGLEMST